MPGILNKILGKILSTDKDDIKQESLYYRHLHSEYEHIDPYVNLLDQWRKMEVHPCQDPLYFSPKVPMACTQKKLLSCLGKPQCFYSSDKWLERDILFYKSIFQGYSSELEFHFHKKRLFYFKYSFSFLSNEDMDIILSRMVSREKYPVLKQSNNYLLNEAGTVLMLKEQSAAMTIYSFDSNSRAMQELSSMGFFYRKNKEVSTSSQKENTVSLNTFL